MKRIMITIMLLAVSLLGSCCQVPYESSVIDLTRAPAPDKLKEGLQLIFNDPNLRAIFLYEVNVIRSEKSGPGQGGGQNQ